MYAIVAGRVAPDVVTSRSETLHRKNPAMLRLWRRFRQNMKEREFVGDVLNLNVISNHVALQSCAQCFANIRFGIDQKSFAVHCDKDMGVKFAFCIEHAGFDRSRFAGLAQIICDLAIEKSEPVSPCDAKLSARGEVEETRSPRL